MFSKSSKLSLLSPKSQESHIRLRERAENHVNIPEGFDDVKYLTLPSHEPRVSSIQEVEREIGIFQCQLEEFEKALYIYEKYFLESYTPRSPKELEVSNLNCQLFQKSIPLIIRALYNLINDHYTKKQQLEKRNQKRKRYRLNKKNKSETNQDDWAGSD